MSSQARAGGQYHQSVAHHDIAPDDLVDDPEDDDFHMSHSGFTMPMDSQISGSLTNSLSDFPYSTNSMDGILNSSHQAPIESYEYSDFTGLSSHPAPAAVLQPNALDDFFQQAMNFHNDASNQNQHQNQNAPDDLLTPSGPVVNNEHANNDLLDLFFSNSNNNASTAASPKANNERIIEPKSEVSPSNVWAKGHDKQHTAVSAHTHVQAPTDTHKVLEESALDLVKEETKEEFKEDFRASASPSIREFIEEFSAVPSPNPSQSAVSPPAQEEYKLDYMLQRGHSESTISTIDDTIETTLPSEPASGSSAAVLTQRPQQTSHALLPVPSSPPTTSSSVSLASASVSVQTNSALRFQDQLRAAHQALGNLSNAFIIESCVHDLISAVEFASDSTELVQLHNQLSTISASSVATRKQLFEETSRYNEEATRSADQLKALTTDDAALRKVLQKSENTLSDLVAARKAEKVRRQMRHLQSDFSVLPSTAVKRFLDFLDKSAFLTLFAICHRWKLLFSSRHADFFKKMAISGAVAILRAHRVEQQQQKLVAARRAAGVGLSQAVTKAIQRAAEVTRMAGGEEIAQPSKVSITLNIAPKQPPPNAAGTKETTKDSNATPYSRQQIFSSCLSQLQKQVSPVLGDLEDSAQRANADADVLTFLTKSLAEERHRCGLLSSEHVDWMQKLLDSQLEKTRLAKRSVGLEEKLKQVRREREEAQMQKKSKIKQIDYKIQMLKEADAWAAEFAKGKEGAASEEAKTAAAAAAAAQAAQLKVKEIEKMKQQKKALVKAIKVKRTDLATLIQQTQSYEVKVKHMQAKLQAFSE